jgi:hypothetical protein
MVLEKIIYDVREALNQYSDDNEIDSRYIIYLYGIKRAKYLRQDLNNFNRSIDNSIQQQLCLKMEEVSINTCGLDFECDTILRTTQSIPKPLELHTKTSIVNVKPTNRVSIPFNFVNKSRIYYLEGAEFPNSLYAFLDTDNYIYVYSKNEDFKNLECLTITGIFEDPLELKNYKNCCSCKPDLANQCFDEMTSDYPLQPHYIDLIKNEIVNDLIKKLQIPEDKTNNSID